MGKLDFIYNRHSVRNFKDVDVPMHDIREIIKAATYAPSGKNIQNWHFVVVKDKELINKMAESVEKKNAEISSYLKEEAKKKSFRGFVNYHTVFRHAPAVILVYAGPYPSVEDDLKTDGLMPPEKIEQMYRAHPGIQNIASAMENLVLSATALGYGTCWMTGPTYAAEEITALVGFSRPNYYLAAMTPLGVPLTNTLTNPLRKSLDEVLTIIE